MIHQGIRITLFLVLAGSLGARQQAPELRVTSCPAADSALGPLTAPQRKSRLVGYYSAAADRSFIRIDNASLGSAGISAFLRWQGRVPESSAAELHVYVPTTLLREPLDLRDSLSLLVDDTLRLDLGPPAAPTFRGERLPPFAPMSAPLSSSHLLALSRAARVVVSFRGTNIKAAKNELAALNALFRTFTCGVILSER